MAPLDVENPPSNLQWLRDGYPLPNATQPSLEFSSLKPENEGTYTVVATNCFGATTNGPVPLVVNNVVTSTYFLLGFQGVPGSQVTLEASSDLSSAQNWRSFTNLSLLTSTSTWVDTATTDFQQRFFRADRPLKTVGSLPGWELNQPMGTRQRIDYVDSYTGITNWQWLTNVTLTSTPALFIDVTATNGLRRYYRTLPLP